MANGTRGDHPLTDILNHGLTVYSPEVDGLVSNSTAGHAAYLEPRLREMRDRMRADARARGWEVDQ